jgi:hypothetical protein
MVVLPLSFLTHVKVAMGVAQVGSPAALVRPDRSTGTSRPSLGLVASVDRREFGFASANWLRGGTFCCIDSS